VPRDLNLLSLFVKTLKLPIENYVLDYFVILTLSQSPELMRRVCEGEESQQETLRLRLRVTEKGSFLRFAQDSVCPLLVILTLSLSEGEESHPFFTQEVFQLESSFASLRTALRGIKPLRMTG